MKYTPPRPKDPWEIEYARKRRQRPLSTKILEWYRPLVLVAVFMLAADVATAGITFMSIVFWLIDVAKRWGTSFLIPYSLFLSPAALWLVLELVEWFQTRRNPPQP